jgi:hypothetical protein
MELKCGIASSGYSPSVTGTQVGLLFKNNLKCLKLYMNPSLCFTYLATTELTASLQNFISEVGVLV